MNLDFTPAEQQFRSEVRDWLADNVPRERRPHDGPSMEAFDRAWMRQQFEAGWGGLAWPSEYGGRGLSLIEQLIWFEELAAADAPSVGCFYVAVNHGGPTLITLGTDEQKAFHLPRILRGDSIWCQGFSEPGSGSDLASLRTRAEIDGEHLVVNGQKIWTSFGQHAQYQELLVRTDPTSSRHKGISWVICDMSSPGIDIRPIRSMDGSAHLCEVFYNDVRIPLSNVVGQLNEGWSVSMTTLGFERGTGMLYDQIEMAKLVDSYITQANQKNRSGRRLIDNGELASRLARLRAEVSALRAMSAMTISRAQRDGTPGIAGTMVALYTTETMQRVYRMGLDLQGAQALECPHQGHSASREYLASFMHTIGGGTSEIRRNIIGERGLGLAR
jgi:alkylation response protein AidB-like acyl-CoA dehydrogenase